MAKHFVIFMLLLNLLMPVALSTGPQPEMPRASEKPAGGKVQGESTLEELVKADTLAYIIWNITKEYNIKLSRPVCQTELEENPEIIRFYIVNVTLEKTVEIIDFFPLSAEYDKSNLLQNANELYERRKNFTAFQELYLRTVERIVDSGSEKGGAVCSRSSNSTYGCFSEDAKSKYEETFEEFKESNGYLWEFIMFGTYVDPTFRIAIMVVALTANGALLFAFFVEKTLRKESNTMIFNLLVNNIFMAVFFLPTNYITTYQIYASRASKFELFLSAQVFVVSANAVIILLVNVQRYFDVSRIFDASSANSRLSPKRRFVIYTSVIWVFSSVVAVHFLFLGPINSGALQILIYFLVYVFIFSVVMAFFNSMTARKLQRSAEQGQTSSEFQSLTGSAVILHLTFVYYVTHVLYYIYTVFEGTFFVLESEYFSFTSIRVVVLILRVIFLSYPCLTVLALYKSSGTYRSFLKFYLFRCWYDPQEGQYATMDTGENTDAQRLCA